MRRTNLAINLTSSPFNSVFASAERGSVRFRAPKAKTERLPAHGVLVVLAHVLMFLAVTSGLGISPFAQSTKPNGSQKIPRQSPEAMAAVLENARKSGALVDATIEMNSPISANVLEGLNLPGKIKAVFVTSTTTDNKGVIFSTVKSSIRSLAEGLRSYEQYFGASKPGNRLGAYAMTGFTIQGSPIEVVRARDSFYQAQFLSIREASQSQGTKSLSADQRPNVAFCNQVPTAVTTFAPTNAELTVETLSNSERKIAATFSWNSPSDLAGFSDDRSALEIQVLFLNHADHPSVSNNISYVGRINETARAIETNFNGYLDDPFGDEPDKRQFAIGSERARYAFQAGPKYTMSAIVEGGELAANFMSFSFERGIYRPTEDENPCVHNYCQLNGGSDPASCVAGVETFQVTRKNYTGSEFSSLAPTVPSLTLDLNHTCLIPPGYPLLSNGLNIPENEAYNLGFRIRRFQRAFALNGGRSVVGCPTNFVHIDTAWWSSLGRTQDFQGGQGGNGAILLGPDSSVAFWIHGGIWTHYTALGGPNGVLGEPTGEEEPVTSSRGTNGAYQGFAQGWLYYHQPKNQTFYVKNAIADKYRSVGLHADPLGFPISNEYEWAGGARNDFEGGYISWTAAAGAVIVRYPYYEGFIDYYGCDVLRGWAADRTRLNTSIDIKIYDGATLIATVPANQSRPDVGSYLGDNGLHGFNIPTPASLKNGQPHAVGVRFESSATNVGGSPLTLTCSASPTPTPTPTPVPGANYEGYIDYYGCDVLRGWAADRNRLNTSIDIKIYDGATLIAAVPANQSRPDVGSYLHDNGLHGFNIATPASLKNGQPHTVSIKFESSATHVVGSPLNINCSATPTPTPTPTPAPGANYEGYIDYYGCDVIRGWGADRNRLNTSIDIKIYDGATLIAAVPANQSRSDVGSYLHDNGLHGFNIATPASLKNGQPHTVSIKFESSATHVVGSPLNINCSATPTPTPTPTPAPGANYEGYIDYYGCDVIRGWGADRNRLNTSIDIKIYDGATLIATVPATQSRPDVGSYLHDNGLHGFNIATPASLKNGQPHTVSIKFESSATHVVGSPLNINCSASPTPTPTPTPAPGANYEGYIDYYGCDVLRGWAADRNRLNTAIDVKIYDGATLIATVPANQARPDVGSYLHDNGLHGFNIATPASLKNGQPHTVSIKFESSATHVVGSPLTLTCSLVGPTPQVNSISPNPVPTFNANQNVQVFGSNFQSGLTVDVYNSGGVRVGTLSGSQIQNVTSTSFTMVIFLGSSAGNFGIEVINPDTARSTRFTFTTTTPTPFVSSISPSSPPAVNSNQNVQVSGGNFQNGLVVDVFNSAGTKIGTLTGSQVLNVSPNSFTMVINLGSTPGNFGIEVLNPSGGRSTRFNFSTHATNPSVSSISPNPVPTFNANQNVQVFGSNFLSGLTVDVFNGSGVLVGTLSGSQIQGVTSTSFTMVIFLGSGAGTFGIEVVNPGGARSTRFTFSTTTPTPAISSISPNPVPVFNGNQNVQAFGSNFQSGLIVDVFNSSGVKIGTLSGSQVLNVTPTSFTMVINLGGTASNFGIEVLNPSGRRSTRFNFSTH